jgi:hypothetical protein
MGRTWRDDSQPGPEGEVCPPVTTASLARARRARGSPGWETRTPGRRLEWSLVVAQLAG